MATYGLTNGSNSPGVVGFTGFSPTLGVGRADTPATVGQVYYNGISQDDYRLGHVFRKDYNGRVLKAMLLALTGAVAGGTATATQKRPTAVVGGNNSGLIAIETITIVNRATTAADVTAFTALYNRMTGPATYAVDVSGNGGGGKLGLI